MTRPRIYTRTGDTGDTGLFGGGRVSKASARVAAYGDVDELNAWLGWMRTQVANEEIGVRLKVVQSDLFTLGAHLATPPKPRGKGPELPALPDGRIAEFEAWIDAADDVLPDLRAFILPGGSPGAAVLHVARTTCRRAERSVVALMAHETVAGDIVVYLNRLSDLLFTWARLENHTCGVPDVPWQPTGPRP